MVGMGQMVRRLRPHGLLLGVAVTPLIMAATPSMAQQPDFRDGLYKPDDGPHEVLTFPTMSIPNLFFGGPDDFAVRQVVIKVSWPRDLPATLSFPGPQPVNEICDEPPPPPPPPPIGLPPEPRPPEPHCYPDPNYQPYPGGPNGGREPPPEAVHATTSYPYPLIIWSHGPNEPFRNYYHLVHHLVSHGYVVVQVQHYDARELEGTPMPQVVNGSITTAYAVGHPPPQPSDYSDGVVQLSGGPCYYRWVGSNTTLINTLEGFGLEQPYLAILGLAVQPIFEGVVDTVGSLVGATGLRLEYQCFEANAPDSLLDVPGWYFIPQLGANDSSSPAGQYFATSQEDGGPVDLDCTGEDDDGGDGDDTGGGDSNQPLRRTLCATRSTTTVPLRNNTIRYTRWLHERSDDFMGLLENYLGDLQGWQDDLQLCLDNADILDRQWEIISVLKQITQSPISDDMTVRRSPQFVDEMIDQQRGIQNRYTFAPGTPEQVIMDNNGICPEPAQGGEQTVPYCVLRDDVLRGKIDFHHIGLGGFAQGAAAVVDIAGNPPADAIPIPEFYAACGFFDAHIQSPEEPPPVAPPPGGEQPPGEEPPPEEPGGISVPPIEGYFVLDPQYDNNVVFRDDYSWTYFSRPLMEVLSPGGNAAPFQNSPLGDKYLATIPGTDDYFGGIRRRPEDECPPGDTSYPCTRDDGFYNELTNPIVADYVQSLAVAFFDAHVHYDEQNRRRPARTFLKSNQVTEATGQAVQFQYK